MHLNTVTYCTKGYDRYDKELTEQQITEIIESPLTIYVVVHSEQFNVLVVDDKYLLNKTDVETTLNLQLSQLQKDNQVSHLGEIHDQPLCLVKVNINSDKFVRFYELQYPEFDCLSQITGVCYSLTKYHWYQQYCCQCREELVFENRNNVYKRCLECQQTYYPQLQPATICLVTFGDKALLCHRRQNIYTTLSGFVEPLETSEQTLIRELNEEIGLHADEIEEIRFQEFDQPWPSRYCALMLPYVIRLKSQFNPIKTDEIDDFKWVDKVEFMEAAGRCDQGLLGDNLEWITPNKQTIARYMMELFFSGYNYFQ